MEKNGAYYELRRTALEVFKIYFFRLGKRKPVRQLEKTGSVLILQQQILYTHGACKDKSNRLFHRYFTNCLTKFSLLLPTIFMM